MSDTEDPEHDDLLNDATIALNSLSEADRSSPSPYTTDPEYDQLLDDANTALDAVSEADRSSPPRPSATLDGLKHARDIKARVNKRLNILKPKSIRARTRPVEEDPDNQAIKTMRQKHNMTWDSTTSAWSAASLRPGHPRQCTRALCGTRRASRLRTARSTSLLGTVSGIYNFIKNISIEIRR
jgi:hypothetical protein